SAPTYYPEVARVLGADVVVPEDADVANAIGAVVGRVRVEATATVSRPEDGLFRVHCAGEPRDFHDPEAALAFADGALQELARGKAELNGAADVAIQLGRETVSAVVADREIILEWKLTAVATGRPGF